MKKSQGREVIVMDQILRHLPVLVIIIPLAGALLCPAIGYFNGKISKRVVIASLFVSTVLAAIQLIQVIKVGEPIHYYLGNWSPPIGIEFVIDGLNGTIVLLVAMVAFMTALYASPIEYLERKIEVRSVGFCVILCLLAVGLMGMSSTGDAFNLYVFMEIVSLASYGLIAIGDNKAPVAAFRYLMIGTIGASMYLLGIGFLYASTGTLNMADMARLMPDLVSSPLITIAAAFILFGFGIKMALFPLHDWQPGAYSNAHMGAAPLIAGVGFKVPAYAMLRFMFCIFDETSPIMETFLNIIGLMAVCGIIYGSLKALAHTTYNKILAYSSIGQVGYIAMGFAIGNYYGIIGAVLHIVSHTFMKAGLFYASGALKYKYGIKDINDFGQIYRENPFTGLSLVIYALSMVGLPPFAGFFSKWYLALGAIEAGQYYYVAVLILSSLLGAIYFFRIIEKIFMEEKKVTETGNVKSKVLELPWQMITALLVCAILVIAIGLGNSFIVNNVLSTTVMEVLLS